MSEQIKAPGRTALWTEAALRALTGTAFLAEEEADYIEDGPVMSPDYARVIALDAMAIADAFERACEERHAAACADEIKRIEAMREKVRQTKRYYAQDGAGVVPLTVASVIGSTVTFEPHASTGWKELKADLADVMDAEVYRPACDSEAVA